MTQRIRTMRSRGVDIMYEHPSFTYNTILVEQERVDRANELRRVIAENPSRIVPRAHPVRDRIRGWFSVRRADAAAQSAPSDSPRVISEQTAQPVHAR
ncbi:hypothetical protein [Microbacterium sp. AK031]|uniref:hypothetical protein n=1 Tax=Microbacterium sp. AK031 TaxID=2723076 RepID=UPI002168D260|nr:hypothetical protein [Microbacterium sp. AK031]